MNIELLKNIKIHYSDQGSGKGLVLLHGFLEDLSMWDTVIETLKKTHRVICIDLLGHGKTGFLVPPSDIPGMSSAIQGLIDNSELAARMGQAGAKSVASSFTHQGYLDQIKQQMEQMI